MSTSSLSKIKNIFKNIEAIRSLILVGSRSRNEHNEESDFDIGLYYSGYIQTTRIKNTLVEISDITNPKIEGLNTTSNIINGQIWTVIDGKMVDIHCLKIKTIEKNVEDSLAGKFYIDAYLTYPFPFYTYMRLASIVNAKILYDPDQTIKSIKKNIDKYPDSLTKNIAHFFIRDAKKMSLLAHSYLTDKQLFLFKGAIARAINDLVQVLYAINKHYFPGYKRLLKHLSSLQIKPKSLCPNIQLLTNSNPNYTIDDDNKLYVLEEMIKDIITLSRNYYISKPHIDSKLGWF